MSTLAEDIRFALRVHGRNGVSTAAAVLCIGLGIGATTAIFSLVDAVLLRPFPGPDPERLVVVPAVERQAGVERGQLAYLDFTDLARASRSFSALAATTGVSVTLSGAGGGSGGGGEGEPERVPTAAVSAGLFPLLGFAPAQGRGFLPEDDRAGAPAVILLSDALWRRRFGADPQVLGRAIEVNELPCTIVGVMPPRFGFPGREEAWIPLAPRFHDSPRDRRAVNVIGRLAPGVSRQAAEEEAAAFAADLARAYPDSHGGWGIAVRPMREMFAGPRARRMLGVSMGAVLFVLLIACANVANLLLARATGRRREMAVRAAFGAPRGRIVRQLLTESVLLAFAGGALGLVVARLGIQAIERAIPDAAAPAYWIQFTLDARVLLFTALAALGTGLLFGLAPALAAARGELTATLKEGGRGAAGGAARSRLRSALVVGEIALSLVLLIGASLFVRSLVALEDDDGGFDARPLLSARFFLPGERYEDEAARVRRIEDVVGRLAAAPGVQAVAASVAVPLSTGGAVDPVELEGKSFARGRAPRTLWVGVTPGFFAALGVALERGRVLAPEEGFAKRPVAVVNHTFAGRFFPGEEAVGRRFRIAPRGEPGEWMTIVGVVADFQVQGLDDELLPAAFLPLPYFAGRNMGLLVRTGQPPASLASTVRAAVRASDPKLPVFDVKTMVAVRELNFWQYRLLSGMFGTFGLLALALATVGIYGVLSYAVGQRRRELGVRVALGARRRAVIGLVVRQGLALAASGIALGLLGAVALTRVLSGYLFEISPTDPVSFGGLALLLVGVAALASYLPARKATEVDPLEALRAE